MEYKTKKGVKKYYFRASDSALSSFHNRSS